MAVKVTLADGIGWRTVHNKIKEKMINDSLVHTLKTTKKIKRRTKALNIKLKRYASRNTYRRYIRTKTIVLRNITDNADTDDDVDIYHVGVQSSPENSPLRCSPQGKNVSIGSPNSDFANVTDCASMPRKQKKQTRKKDIIESHSSTRLPKRKLEESKKEPRVASVDSKITQVKGLTKVKRNLTSLLENFEDDTNIIDESMEIDERNGEDNSEAPQNTESENSVQLENFHNNEIAHENTEFESERMSINSDAESNDKSMIECAAEAIKIEQEEQQSVLKETQPLVASADNEITKVKRLRKVKRNATSLLENFEDDTNIIDESMEIDERNGEDDYESPQNTESQDSVELENFHKDKIAHENTEFASDKMSVNSDDGSNDKPTIECAEATVKIEQEEQQSMLEEILTKKSQPVITSTEIVRSKYTIVRDEDEATDSEDTSHGECSDLKTSPSSCGNEFLTDQQDTRSAKKLSSENERVDQIKRINTEFFNNSDNRESKNDEVDADKCLVSPNNDSGSSCENKMLSDQETKSPKKRSAESKRVGQLKGINLESFNNSDSRKSQNDGVDANKCLVSPNNDSGSSCENKILSEQETKSAKKRSAESKRVGQLKGINLEPFNNSDSQESQNDGVDDNKCLVSPNIDSGSSCENKMLRDQETKSPKKRSAESKRVGQLKGINLESFNNSDNRESKNDEIVANKCLVSPKNDSGSSCGNKILSDQETKSPKKRSAESKRVGQLTGINLEPFNNSDSQESQNDGVDASKCLASPVIDSDSSCGNKILSDQETKSAKKRSAESKRVGQLKGINLESFNNSDSQESQNDEVVANKCLVSPKNDSGSSCGNKILSDQETKSPKKRSAESKRVGQLKGINLEPFNNSDSQESQNDGVDDNKCLVSPDIDSGSSCGNKMLSDQLTKSAKKRSAESKRIGQLKGINLVLFNSSDSEESQASKEDRVDANKHDSSSISNCRIDESEESARPSCSQIINDPTNSDESTADPDDTNHHPITTSSSISEKATLLNTVMSKSILSQIREQENFYSSTPLKNIAESSSQESKNNSGGEEQEQVDDNYSRPMELSQFVERERLVPNEELSTITAKDFKQFALENGDEEIWLMEIPKSIITDGDELCGKTMAFENGKMTINGTTYKTTCREEKSVTCILRSRKKKTRFKTVNVEAIDCIVVREEFSDKKVLPVPPVQCAQEFESVVPFPKNLKSRNPLLGVNSPNDMDHFKHLKHQSSTEDTNEIFQAKKKVKRKGKGTLERQPLYFT